MVKFLIQRPIAVLMAFTACFIVGMVTYFTLPVSLLPDIAIPEITRLAGRAGTGWRRASPSCRGSLSRGSAA